MHDQRRDVFTSLIKSKKSSKIYIDRGSNSDLRSPNIEIKKSTKRCHLTSFHAKSDHFTCTHARKIPASIWPSDKSGKIIEKLLKISYQM